MKRSVKAWGICASFGLALGFGGAAKAAVVLDQSDIPLTGPIAVIKATGGTALNNPTRLGQSFSVGKTGILSEIDLGLIRTVDRLEPDIQFDVRNTSNQVLYSTTIDGSTVPLFNFNSTMWDAIPRVDVSAANLQVTAGEELWFTLAPTPNSAQTALIFQADGVQITYPTGTLFNFTAGGAPLPAGATGDYAFRTFVSVPDAPPPVIFPPGNGEPGDNNGIDAVPEPAQWALMLVGFGGAGAMLRHRRRLAASVA